MTSPNYQPVPADAADVHHLEHLLAARSKHCTYQELHPLLGQLIGLTQSPAGKSEAARWKHMNETLPLLNQGVLDIGANTGYFSLAAVEAGAGQVTAVEGNAEHAKFIEASADWLGWQHRLQVQNRYFEFEQSGDCYDTTICLNVLHHLGDDFGDQQLNLDQARQGIVQRLNRLAHRTRNCWLQLGFNWKGQRDQGLFPLGRKGEVIEFIQNNCHSHWKIKSIAIYNPKTKCYDSACKPLLERFDSIGEFLNRPLFLLESTSKYNI